MSTVDPEPEHASTAQNPAPPPSGETGADLPEEGDEPQVERAETISLPLKSWVVLWAVPIVVVVVVLVIVIAITNP